MRFSFAFAFLTIAMSAQTLQIKVEAQYDTVSITNLHTSPVTALIAWAPLEEPRRSRQFLVVEDPIAFEPEGGLRVTVGSHQRRLLHIDGRAGISVGVLFADGTSAGDPDAVQKLIDHRRETALAISSVLAAIRPLVNDGASRSALIARVEQLGQPRMTGVALTPSISATTLVASRTADLLTASDHPATVIAALEHWRDRVEGN